jgi:hypothetical protein
MAASGAAKIHAVTVPVSTGTFLGIDFFKKKLSLFAQNSTLAYCRVKNFDSSSLTGCGAHRGSHRMTRVLPKKKRQWFPIGVRRLEWWSWGQLKEACKPA